MFIIVAYPSLESCCRKKSLAASFMAFSGVTRVRFTAAPSKHSKHKENSCSQSQLCTLCVHCQMMGKWVNCDWIVNVFYLLRLTSVHPKVAIWANGFDKAIWPVRGMMSENIFSWRKSEILLCNITCWISMQLWPAEWLQHKDGLVSTLAFQTKTINKLCLFIKLLGKML